MKVFSPQSALLVFTALMTFVPVTLQAQSQAATPSQTPAPKSAPNAAPPKYTEEQMQEMIGKLQDRIKKAADSVIGRIQKEEAGVHLKFSYFRKPERLDPARGLPLRETPVEIGAQPIPTLIAVFR